MNTDQAKTQPPQRPRNILVVGATGGTGLAAVEQLLSEGHRVTAFSRSAVEKFEQTPGLTPVNGDVMNALDVAAAVRGHDAVIVVLGISENPLRVRILGTRNTPLKVRSEGTQNVINAMREHGVQRLVVQSSYGVGETRSRLRFIDQLFFWLLLKPQIGDTEQQEQKVRDSGTQWILAQPVHLTDSADREPPYLSVTGEVRTMKVARHAVAQFLSVAALQPDYIGKTVSISG